MPTELTNFKILFRAVVIDFVLLAKIKHLSNMQIIHLDPTIPYNISRLIFFSDAEDENTKEERLDDLDEDELDNVNICIRNLSLKLFTFYCTVVHVF